jgi:hypothetical protein
MTTHVLAGLNARSVSMYGCLYNLHVTKCPGLCSVYATPKVCVTLISMGAFQLNCISSTASLENTMSKMHNVAISTALIISALTLSACATKPQEAPVAVPAPVAATQEAAPVPEAAPAPVVAAEQPAPAVAAAQPAPKPVVKKAKKKVVKAAPPKAEPVAPVVAPAPVVKQETPVAAPVAAPAPVVTVTPLPKAATPGFLEQYWMWLLGLIVAIVAILWMRKKN